MSKLSRRHLLQMLAAGAGLPLLHRLTPKPLRQNSADTPNILFVVFDTLSARHMSLYGYERETTPNLARLVQRATVYQRHYASGNFTSPGTASLLTGTYPWTNRAFHIRGSLADSVVGNNIFRTAADAGLETVAFSQNGLVEIFFEQFGLNPIPANNWSVYDSVSAEIFFDLFHDNTQVRSITHDTLVEFGGSSLSTIINRTIDDIRVGRLLNEYSELYPVGLPMNEARRSFFLLEDVVDGVVDTIAKSPQPFLGYFHLLPPHSPFRPTIDFYRMFDGDGYRLPKKALPKLVQYDLWDSYLDQERRRYDEFVAFVDAEFGRLYAKLEADGILDNTILIFTSDHGELFERSWIGHITPLLYEDLIRIPLIIWEPQQHERRDVTALTSAVDLLPTVQQWLDQPITGEGQVLPPYAATNRDTIFAIEAKTNPKYAPLTQATVALLHENYKLIAYLGYEEVWQELYDVVADPHEQFELGGVRGGVSAELNHRLQQKLKAINNLS